MASFSYNSFVWDVLNSNINVHTDTFYVMLVDSTYSANRSHSKRDQVTGEVVGSGYTAGGKVVTLTIQSVDNINNDVEISFSTVTWDPSTITARGAVIYKRRGGVASTEELVHWFDFVTNRVSLNCPFELIFTTNMKFQYE